MDNPNAKGRLFVLSGPSGSGKSTIKDAVLRDMANVHFSVSATTRPPRPEEVNGQDYFFLSKEQFAQMEKDGQFLEFAHYEGSGEHYGTPLAPILEKIEKGVDVLLDIEVQGAKQVREKMPEAILVFLFPPSMEILEKRLRDRGTDSEDKIQTRLQTAKQEYAERLWYDYLIINDSAFMAIEQMKGIILAEKCKL